MLKIMCEERGAKFYVPEMSFMGDNVSMIAYGGLFMMKAGVTTPQAESEVGSGTLPTRVEVRWR